MLRIISIVALLNVGLTYAQGPFAPVVGQPGTTAIYRDSSIIVGWATGCEVTRGLQDLSNTGLGYASSGQESYALGASDPANISLGDGGYAILTFDDYLFDGPGPDFAVFENSFDGLFLELAFVEVSSNGIDFYRFDAISKTQILVQIDTFGVADATNLYNLAGKYQGQYGTPFDLAELDSISGLNINAVTHIKIIDVVGSINTLYGTKDSKNNYINDPFPTPFPTGGFDLDAIGLINATVSIDEIKEVHLNIYPNPARQFLNVDVSGRSKIVARICSLHGEIIKMRNFRSTLSIDVSDLSSGFYILQLVSDQKVITKKFQKL